MCYQWYADDKYQWYFSCDIINNAIITVIISVITCNNYASLSNVDDNITAIFIAIIVALF